MSETMPESRENENENKNKKKNKNKKENKKDKNMEEWNRINNIWLDIKNKNKVENPYLYNTDSDNSVDNTPIPSTPSTFCNHILKKSNSFCSYDEEISNSNDFVNMPPCHDSVYDEYNLDSGLYTPCSSVTQNSIKCKYTNENTASLELDYSLNYNMKMLTHIGNYYEILKSKHSVMQTTKPKPTTKTTTKMCKSELIKNIVAFETNEMNYRMVYQCKKMLEYIEAIKGDKYFASFVIFP